MSQTLSETPSFTLPGPSKRLAQFGVAVIATLLVACFGVLIAARGDHVHGLPQATAVVAE